MIFGHPAAFAIEIGVIERFSDSTDLFVQFRFRIGGCAIGDWDDRISLIASIENSVIVCKNEHYRREYSFEFLDSHDAFRAAYDAFFSYDYSTDPILIPSLRDRFHLDWIGMGAIQDKYGVLILQNSPNSDRIIVKDLNNGNFIVDILIKTRSVDNTLSDYITWFKARQEGEEKGDGGAQRGRS